MRFLIGLIAAAALSFAVEAQAQSHNFGPAVGATLPAISAPDETGATRTLTSLAGENGIVLVVTRAADWCPYCQVQMIGLEGARAQIDQRGYRVVTISTDTVEQLARFEQRRNIGYTLLSDERAQIVRQLGLLDPTEPPPQWAAGADDSNPHAARRSASEARRRRLSGTSCGRRGASNHRRTTVAPLPRAR